MPKYALTVDQLSDLAHGAARAAEQAQTHTIIYRESTPIAAIVPISDLKRLSPEPESSDDDDPLLSLCGTCQHDDFVDSITTDLGRTSLFQAPKNHRIRRP